MKKTITDKNNGLDYTLVGEVYLIKSECGDKGTFVISNSTARRFTHRC